MKLENILYATKDADSVIKIIDFSLARILPNEILAMTVCGTPGYVAPEVLKGDGYGKEVDYWSIGIILYTLLCGYKPFTSDSTGNDDELFEKIKKGEFTFPSEEWDDISDLAKDLVSKLLETDPSKRLDAEGILNHPWMQATENLDSESSESEPE